MWHRGRGSRRFNCQLPSRWPRQLLPFQQTTGRDVPFENQNATSRGGWTFDVPLSQLHSFAGRPLVFDRDRRHGCPQPEASPYHGRQYDRYPASPQHSYETRPSIGDNNFVWSNRKSPEADQRESKGSWRTDGTDEDVVQGLEPVARKSRGVNMGRAGATYIPATESFCSEGSHQSTQHHLNNTVDVPKDDSTQREQLTSDLFAGSYECMVCCERVRMDQAIWNCHNCYNIFHLRCIQKWARSSMVSTEGSGWRCPSCQNVCVKVPFRYVCFCGKRGDPLWNRYDVPHSCGEQCGKVRKQRQDPCRHPCNLLCHPGPCPPCGMYVTRACFCQKTSQKVRCGESSAFCCVKTCDKRLSCGRHRCVDVCHSEQCKPCDHKIVQECFCGKEVQQVACECNVEEGSGYSCGAICGRVLGCVSHTCQSPCHSGSCKACMYGPEVATHCPCGQTPLSELMIGKLRTQCTEPIPTCRKSCGKLLPCGPSGDRHRCRSACHTGQCKPCHRTASVRCRCGGRTRKLACTELAKGAPILCQRQCSKWKSCGRHRCHQICCTDSEHPCSLVCRRTLKCGHHKCDEVCHGGSCPPCLNARFDELSCHCGASVLYPPIACGTRPPPCNQPCIRPQSCRHPVRHQCHRQTQCPPCTALVEKWCYGKHENNVCCGMPCGNRLSCEQHKCKRICHPGVCLENGVSCTQPCDKARPQCGHPCGKPCHTGDCQPGPCTVQVTVKCKCGHRSETMTCVDRAKAHSRLVSNLMASTLKSTHVTIKLDVTESSIDGTILNCIDECAKIERNKRLALALKIENPDFSANFAPPTYSDFLKEQTRLNPVFVASVYEKLADLVEGVKQKQKSASHAFPPMKRERRHVVHELAEFFGCRTQSYDAEPKKNVAVTAYRDKSCLPSVSVMAVVQKETGAGRPAGKAPPPVPHYDTKRHRIPSEQPKNARRSLCDTSRTRSHSNVRPTLAVNNEIDYFDFTHC